MDIQEIFQENVIASIATINEGGSPWATPVHGFSDGEAVYWFSFDQTIHSQNIVRDPRVSFVMWSSDRNAAPKGIYLNGEAIVLDDEATQAAKEIVKERLGEVPAVFAAATGYKMPIGAQDEQNSRGNCWYFYT